MVWPVFLNEQIRAIVQIKIEAKILQRLDGVDTEGGFELWSVIRNTFVHKDTEHSFTLPQRLLLKQIKEALAAF